MNEFMYLLTINLYMSVASCVFVPWHNFWTDLWCQATRKQEKNCIQVTSLAEGGNGKFISDNKEAKYVAYSDK